MASHASSPFISKSSKQPLTAEYTSSQISLGFRSLNITQYNTCVICFSLIAKSYTVLMCFPFLTNTHWSMYSLKRCIPACLQKSTNVTVIYVRTELHVRIKLTPTTVPVWMATTAPIARLVRFNSIILPLLNNTSAYSDYSDYYYYY